MLSIKYIMFRLQIYSGFQIGNVVFFSQRCLGYCAMMFVGVIN